MPTSAVFTVFEMKYQPPAKSPAPFYPLISWFFGVKPNFEAQLQKYLSAREVVIGDAWVVVLAEGLKALKAGHHGTKIILPAYSCNEFTKAILLANLSPVYVDLANDFSMRLGPVAAAFDSEVLGVLAVNNTGVPAENSEIRAFCDEKGIFCIEDAGYTLFGNSSEGRLFGSIGHVAIVNMSEGKIIPAGGAAWVVNQEQALHSAAALRKRIYSQPARSRFSEALQLLIYALGSSSWGFHVYTLLKKAGFGDLKARFSSEPTRKGEDYASGELAWQEGQMRLSPLHHQYLQAMQARPWNTIRHGWAQHIFVNRLHELDRRNSRLNWWHHALGEKVDWVPLAARGFPVKLPVLLDVNNQRLSKLAQFGIKKQYPPSWPMNLDVFAHSKTCYQRLFTLPVHAGMSKKTIFLLAHRLMSRHD
jgi:hypothetical protein